MLTEWSDFFGVEPWGFEIEWFRTGTVAALIANTAANRRRGSKSFKPADFVPKLKGRSRESMSGKEMRKALRGLAGEKLRMPTKKEPPKP